MTRGFQARGYTALAVMLIAAGAMLLTYIALQTAAGSRLQASQGNNEQQARIIAEAGLERTRAYIGQLLASDVDLDRALDPRLDTDCSVLPFTGGTADDNLPPFGDPGSTVVTAGGGAKRFKLVPYNGGAYLVRIDDDDDDHLTAPGPTVGNHPVGTCLEGSSVVGLFENPVRDTNRTVVVTVIGIYPGVDFDHALAVKTLRAAAGSPGGAGVIAGGDIDMHAGSDSIVGDVQAHGDVDINAAGQVSATGTCGGTPNCTGSASVPPVPHVDPWDVTNAPSAGSGINFYFVDYGAAGAPELFRWNYGACPDPRAFGRICYPSPGDDALGGGTCRACWSSIAQPVGHVVSVPNLPGPPIPMWDVSPPTSVQANVYGGGCDATSPFPSTWTPVAQQGPTWTPISDPRNTFTLLPTATFTGAASGVWLVAGHVSVTRSLAGCADVGSIIALGNIDIDINPGPRVFQLKPAAPKPYILLAGRDLVVHHGNELIDGCGVPAAIMVHEQMELHSGNNQVNAQVVIESAATCSGLVSGAALKTHGNDHIDTSSGTPIGAGPTAVLLDYAESSL